MLELILGPRLRDMKKFCEMLGGSINATSEPGQGSTFEIRLPARAPEPAEEEPGPQGAKQRQTRRMKVTLFCPLPSDRLAG